MFSRGPKQFGLEQLSSVADDQMELHVATVLKPTAIRVAGSSFICAQPHAEMASGACQADVSGRLFWSWFLKYKTGLSGLHKTGLFLVACCTSYTVSPWPSLFPSSFLLRLCCRHDSTTYHATMNHVLVLPRLH